MGEEFFFIAVSEEQQTGQYHANIISLATKLTFFFTFL